MSFWVVNKLMFFLRFLNINVIQNLLYSIFVRAFISKKSQNVTATVSESYVQWKWRVAICAKSKKLSKFKKSNHTNKEFFQRCKTCYFDKKLWNRFFSKKAPWSSVLKIFLPVCRCFQSFEKKLSIYAKLVIIFSCFHFNPATKMLLLSMRLRLNLADLSKVHAKTPKKSVSIVAIFRIRIMSFSLQDSENCFRKNHWAETVLLTTVQLILAPIIQNLFIVEITCETF